ncbi:TMEM175 family protein [Massilia soli]|uniref:TMEM175 family protein n=1 Tax=Massilia soli TaxID=2792854 RepID=A0ABS7ST00_9BURK|nr:TMEM175 family protein [Massilia soli]MBZ2209077.1 TMEM175 family protein [Massilia soli]
MGKNRLEAFSDGVIAIIITIMVLELKVPHAADLQALAPLWPVFLSYILSFIYVGIYWNNHHHLMHSVQAISGRVLWANLHLLFWLSLIPFVSGWMGENHFATLPVAAYGLVLFMCSVAYDVLVRSLSRQQENTMLAEAIGSDRKGILSVVLYLSGVALSFVHPWIGFAVYAGAAVVWLIPDSRLERRLSEEHR